VIKFKLLDNGRPAKYPDIGVHPSWSSCEFNSYLECVKYADLWLGKLSPGVDKLVDLLLNNEYEYSGYGDSLKIVNEYMEEYD